MTANDLKSIESKVRQILADYDEARLMTEPKMREISNARPEDSVYPYWSGYQASKIFSMGLYAKSLLSNLEYLAARSGETEGEYQDDKWVLEIPEVVTLKCRTCSAPHECDVEIGDTYAEAGIDYEKCEHCRKDLCNTCKYTDVGGLWFCMDAACQDAARETELDILESRQ